MSNAWGGTAAYLDRLSERDFQRQVLDLARLHHWTVYHTFDSRRSTAGFPDLVLVRPPRLIFAEIKTQTGKVTPAQWDWLHSLQACGQYAALWRPSDLRRIERTLA